MKFFWIKKGIVEDEHPYTIFFDYIKENGFYEQRAEYIGTEFITGDGYFSDGDKKIVCKKLRKIFGNGAFDRDEVDRIVGKGLQIRW